MRTLLLRKKAFVRCALRTLLLRKKSFCKVRIAHPTPKKKSFCKVRIAHPTQEKKLNALRTLPLSKGDLGGAYAKTQKLAI